MIVHISKTPLQEYIGHKHKTNNNDNFVWTPLDGFKITHEGRKKKYQHPTGNCPPSACSEVNNF